MSRNKAKRIHDSIYLKGKPVIKESFKFLLKEINKNQKNFKTLIDIGCSNGAFLSLVKSKYPKTQLTGLDIRKDLIKLAKRTCPSAKFINMDINNKKSYKRINEKFEVCVLDGVHSIFDDQKIWLNNLIKFCDRHGKIYIFGSFNPNPYDVIVRVKKSGTKLLETGFNRLSLMTMIRELKRRNFLTKIKKFNFNLNLKKNNSDSRRTHTIRLKNDKYLTINGLEQISTKFLVIAWSKKWKKNYT